jgi:hypothetical protein
MMKKIFWLGWVLIVFGGFSQPLLAQEADYSNEPWEKAALYLGGFFITSDSDLELGGGGLGIKVDAEEVLGLDENFTTPQSILSDKASTTFTSTSATMKAS